MLVVSDTSPLNYLLLTGLVDVLPSLYEKVIIPKAVFDELIHPEAPAIVRKWISALPAWCEVRAAAQPDQTIELDQGEREAIGLAVEARADKILLDDFKARLVARSRGLSVTGTVGILQEASTRGLIDFQEALEKLAHTNMRLNPDFMRQIMEWHRGRG
jgi:predicted nucleic acid-binding protein